MVSKKKKQTKKHCISDIIVYPFEKLKIQTMLQYMDLYIDNNKKITQSTTY